MLDSRHLGDGGSVFSLVGNSLEFMVIGMTCEKPASRGLTGSIAKGFGVEGCGIPCPRVRGTGGTLICGAVLPFRVVVLR